MCIGEVGIEVKLDAVFLILWSFVVFVMTFVHSRYEYLAAPAVAIFSGIGAMSLVELINGDRGRFGYVWVSVILAIAAIFSIIAVCAVVESEQCVYEDDWKDALYWVKENSPRGDMDYLACDSQAPDGYAVGAWWDFGHMIVYLAERPAIANPFQNQATEMACFFMTDNESEAMVYVNNTDMAYVIVDARSVNAHYPAMMLWAGGDTNDYYVSTSDGLEFYPPFYKTMAYRLYVLEGDGCVGMGAEKSMDALVPPCGVSPLEHFDMVYCTEDRRVKVFEII